MADAYLSPILRRYIDRIAGPLAGSTCSSCSRMAAEGRQPVPGQGRHPVRACGGIVGAVRTAQQAGFDKVITFDMGGTSTDVAHYENAYERVFETVVAGCGCRRRCF